MARGRKTGGRDFKPGESGNPKGATPIPEDVKEIRSTQPYEVAKIINRVMWMTKAETKKLVDNPDSSNIELAIANCTMRCITQGCVTRLNALTDRWLGKVKEVIMVVPSSGGSEATGQVETKLTPAQIGELFKRAQPKCQSPDIAKSTTKRGRS